MKTIFCKLTIAIQAISTCLLFAQDPPAKPEVEPKAKTEKELRLTGEWELYLGERPTGLLLDLRQINNRVHGNYGNIKPSKKLGISKGTEFFRASITSDNAKGEIVLRSINKESKELETRSNPFRFKILENGDRLDCEIGGEKVKESQKKFTLRRSATVKSFRLLVKTADGWEPSAKIIENMPMAIEAELTSPSHKLFSFSVSNGQKPIKLNAKFISPMGEKKSDFKHIARTPLFYPTFGQQLGVPENPKKKKEEDFGREPTEEDWNTLEGIWRAGYIDKELGEITGWIDFNQGIQNTFSYQDPETEQWTTIKLVKSGILESKDPKLLRKWKFQFDGWGVVGEKVEPANKDGLTELLLDPMVIPVKISHEKVEANVGIERSDIADFRTLYLELTHQQNNNLLAFEWRYTANRETNRDRKGLGRVGEMEVIDPNSTVGTMKGREVWMKNEPNIIATFCTDNQLGLVETDLHDTVYNPLYERREKIEYKRNIPRFRFGDTSSVPDRNGNLVNKATDQNIGKREIFIIATDLPEDLEKRIVVKPEKGSSISRYDIITQGTESEGIQNERLGNAWKAYRDSQKVSADAETSASAATAQLENLSQSPLYGILVTATLKEGAYPGFQTLTMNDVPSEWKLNFGDTVASPQWIRQLASGEEGESAQWEPITVAFRPETIRLSLHAQSAIKEQEQVYASVLVNRKRLPISGDGEKTNFKIPLTPAQNEPNRYISSPIQLVSKTRLEEVKKANPGHIFIVCNKGDVLTAEFQSRPLYTINTENATSLTISITPDSMNALWKIAVKKAAEIAGKPIDNFDSITDEEVEEVTNYIVTNFFVPGNKVKREIKISLGSHAAMLMLRDVFVEMMSEQHTDWKKNQTLQDIKRIFHAHKADIEGRRSPLSYYKIPLQELPQFRGTDMHNVLSLHQILDGFMETHHKFRIYPYFKSEKQHYKYRGLVEDLHFSAFQYAWKHYGGDMAKVISEAKAIPDADIPSLLKLTGHSFKPVVKRLIPRLMKLDINANAKTKRWVPDKIARGHVSSLTNLGSAVRAQADFSKASTNYLLTIASIATIPFGNVGGFWTALAVGSVSAVDLANTVYHDVYKQWDIDQQIKNEIARGKILGVERAAKKQNERITGWQQLLSVGGAALGGVTDGLSVLNAVKGLRTAKLLEAGAEILKRADFADPTVLRSLSLGDQAIIKKIADQAAELADEGKISELTELQRKTIDQAKELDIIFNNDAVKQVEKLNATELAERVKDIAQKTKLDDVDALKNLDEADLVALRRTRDKAENLNQAGKSDELTDIQKSILKNGEKIDNAYDSTPKAALQKEIADRFAAASKPISESKLAEQVENLERKAKDLKKVTSNSRKHLNETKKAYQDAIDAARKTPSAEATNLVKKTGSIYREAKKSTELVNDLTGDITQRAQAAKNMLKQAARGKKVRTTAADDRLLTLNNDKTDINQFIKRQQTNPTKTFTKQERDMMRQISGFKKSDVQHVEKLIRANGGDWSDISKLAAGSGNDMLNMHRVSAYRRLKVNKLADEAITETRKYLRNIGMDEADMIPLERNAFGSANLTSDYDVAIKGSGAELAVQYFNEKARQLFKGIETGAVVDTNLYTDPIYNIFKRSDLTGKIGGLSTQQIDDVRQFVLVNMANAKKRIPSDLSDPASMGQWNRYKKNILKDVPEDAREAMSDLMNQAVGARSLSEKRIADKIANVTESAKKVDGNAKLRATNDLYGETLTEIHHYRRMLNDVNLVTQGKKGLSEIHLPPVLQDSKFTNQLNKIDELMANPTTRARGLQELEQVKRQAILNIRSKQGEALYFASEAYQGKATITHVVDELQAGGQKVTLDSIKKGRETKAAQNSILRPDGYINSFYENAGMLIGELNNKKVLDARGDVKLGLDKKYYNKAAQKVAKYFERQLDAAARAGVDMKKIFAQRPDLLKTAEDTLKLNKVRNVADDFTETIAKLYDVKDANGKIIKTVINPEQKFVQQAIEFNDLIESAAIGQSSILGYANKLAATEDAIIKSAVKYTKPWEAYVALGGKTMQTSRAVSDALANENDDFDNKYRDDLQLLTGKKTLNKPLTTEESQRLRNHQQRFTSMRELNIQSASARSAGISSENIDQIINQAKQTSPDNWRKAATTQVNKILREKAANTKSRDMNDAVISPALGKSLGLKNVSNQPSTVQTLADQFKRSGKYVSVATSPLKISQLEVQAKSGRRPIIMMTDAEGKATWQELRGVTTDSARRKLVHIRDTTTGSDIRMPAALFNLYSQNAKNQIIVDPYRSANGNVSVGQAN